MPPSVRSMGGGEGGRTGLGDQDGVAVRAKEKTTGRSGWRRQRGRCDDADERRQHRQRNDMGGAGAGRLEVAWAAQEKRREEGGGRR